MLIYNQKTDPRGKLRYGFRSSAATGCGWIATYNALHLLGLPAEPEELIHYYQRRFPLLNGTFGTFFPNVAGFFRRRGFAGTRMVQHRDAFDAAVRCGDVCVLYFWWRDGFRFGTHFAAVERREDGFWGYNTYRNSARADFCGPSLAAFLKAHGYFWPVLIVPGKRDANR